MFDQSVWCCICDEATAKAVVYERLVIMNSDEVWCGVEQPVLQPVVGYRCWVSLLGISTLAVVVGVKQQTTGYMNSVLHQYVLLDSNTSGRRNMKSLSYTVYQDKIVCVVNENNKTKTINIILDDSTLLKIPECCLEWDGTIVSAIRSLLFKLNIKYDVCMIETITASPDVVWEWKQKNLVHINSKYSFMWTMEHLTNVYHDWEMLNKVFEKLGYTIEGWEYALVPD